ncbi:MAG: aspartate carbamoyltransferase catalytic subunit [Verrucomicrobiaceae bacterium]|nr:MAG: aspartate carbamoyltransferase catalytic subunit [Verrucomicrobiaceae bacterium]
MKGRKDLLDIESLSVEEINFLLETALPFKNLIRQSVKKMPPLRGRHVLTLFYEPSTRTRSSFEIAAKRLSADVTNFAVSTSSVVKGESIIDTIDTMQAMQVDYIVVRHGAAGVPNLIAQHTKASVINAGDGHHAHPTQGLLDTFTINEVLGHAAGRRIAIVGDIQHSRVARSTSTILRKLGAQVAVFGPGPLIPDDRHSDMISFKTFDELFDWKPDVIYLLRIQMERQKEQFFPSLHEYHRLYGVTDERLRHIRSQGIYVMHPGPVNRGVELVDGVMTYERTLINQQVENGIAARMAVLYWLEPGTLTRTAGD